MKLKKWKHLTFTLRNLVSKLQVALGNCSFPAKKYFRLSACGCQHVLKGNFIYKIGYLSYQASGPQQNRSELYSGSLQVSTIELLAKAVSNLNSKLPTILKNRSILDASLGPECGSAGGQRYFQDKK